MKAIVQDRYGGPESLQFQDRPIPEPADGQVRIKVHASGIDAGLVHLLEGRPFPVRLALPLKGGRVLGLDVAGTVDAVGAGADGWSVGDEVFGVTAIDTGHGALAEFAVASADKLAPLPAGLSFAEAAALPVSATTALRAVRAADVQPGQRVLVLGAAGGVGHFAVQIAKSAGAHVTGACSSSKTALVEALGADEVVDYTARDPLGSDPFDAIIDTGGHRPLRALRRALTPQGALVLVGSEPEGAPLGGLGRGLLAALLNNFTKQRLVMLYSSEDRESLDELSRLVEAGHLKPTISARHPLADAAEAVRRLGRGRGTGKVVVEVREA